jgi:deoxyribose-phosphate aldolase
MEDPIALIEQVKSKIGSSYSAPLGTINREAPATTEGIFALTDLTLLKPEATCADIIALCEKAIQVKAKTVCVNSLYVGLAHETLAGSSVVPIAVSGFPLGSSHPQSTLDEAKRAVQDGAAEIDIVAPAGVIYEKDWALLEAILTTIIKDLPVPVKVILETCLHTDESIVAASLISVAAGAAFVKTSTGFGKAGADPRIVSLMRLTVGDSIGVKASGGIRSLEKAREMIRAGADRIGASGLSAEPSAGY